MLHNSKKIHMKRYFRFLCYVVTHSAVHSFQHDLKLFCLSNSSCVKGKGGINPVSMRTLPLKVFLTMCANYASMVHAHVSTVYCDCGVCKHKIYYSLISNSFNRVSFIWKHTCTIPINNVQMYLWHCATVTPG